MPNLDISIIPKFFNKAKNVVSANSPSILTGCAVAGIISTTVMAVRATPKAIYILQRERNRKNDLIYKEKFEQGEHTWDDAYPDEDLTIFEKIKYAGPCYIPSAIIGAVTITCIISANTINLRRNAAIASLYSISEKTLKEYQDKVKNTIGENKSEKIKDEIAQDRLNNNPVDENSIIFTGEGDTLCYDVLSGRYFKHDIEKIRRIENEFNHALIYDIAMSLNDLYSLMNLPSIGLGDDVGWNVDKLMQFDFRSKLASNGTPCLLIDYSVGPTHEYRFG